MRHASLPCRLACVAMGTALTVAAGCAGNGRSTTRSTPGSSLASGDIPAPPLAPRASDRVEVRGDALLDGASFDSRFVGAVVLRAGLVTPCQYSLPGVTDGHYSVTVLADTESDGCGGTGARVVLWTFANNEILFSTNTLRWPRRGHTATFAARYSTGVPAGAAPTTAQFTGGAFTADGRQLPPGTRVEAFVGATRCGVASLRNMDPSNQYVLAVVGPESVPACTRGATLTLRIDGRPATPTGVVNTPPGRREPLDLRLP